MHVSYVCWYYYENLSQSNIFKDIFVANCEVQAFSNTDITFVKYHYTESTVPQKLFLSEQPFILRASPGGVDPAHCKRLQFFTQCLGSDSSSSIIIRNGPTLQRIPQRMSGVSYDRRSVIEPLALDSVNRNSAIERYRSFALPLSRFVNKLYVNTEF